MAHNREVLEGFLEEALGYLPAMRQELEALEHPADLEANQMELHRLAHSLRGASNVVGFTEAGIMAQNMEEFLDQVIVGESPWDEESRQLLLECLGQIETTFCNMTLDGPAGETAELTFDFQDDDADLSPEMVEVFLEEAQEHLDNTGRRFRELETASDVKPVLLEIRRSVHTVKGAAGMVGLMAINKVAHRMEDLLDHLYEGTLVYTPQAAKLLMLTHDILIDLVAARGAVGNKRPAIEQLFTMYGAVLRGESIETAAPMPLAEVEEPEAADSAKFVRVPMERLDGLVRLVGQLFVNRSVFERHLANYSKEVDELVLSLERLKRLTHQLDTEHAIFSPGTTAGLAANADRAEFDALEFDRYTKLHLLSRDLSETANDVASVGTQLRSLINGFDGYIGRQGRLTTEAQDKLMRLRMVPLANMSNRLHRTVRVTAQKRGKAADLVVNGGLTELDKTVMEQLAGPLEHLLRNAVDHGIEDRETRLGLGKPEAGRIELDACYEGTQVVIRLRDDGRGFDLDRIRKALVRDGLATEEEAAELAAEQLHQFLFVQGFSTADEVTDISGRGVGLDIVNSSVESLKGTLSADSVAGKGTTFSIRLPMTLAITKVLFVEAAQQQFGIPLAGVAKSARVDRALFEKVEQKTFLNFEGHKLAAWHLTESLGLRELQSVPEGKRQAVVVIQLGNKEFALIVDKILDAREVMVKPLGSLLKQVHGMAGATILGDGSVVLILNPADLDGARAESRFKLLRPRKVAAPARRTLEVLIVDDSLSVRRVISNLIKSTGWNPVLAKDGVDALEKLQQGVKPDVILMDVEMPRMDGFELAATLRSRPEFDSVPIIMLTSRSGDKHRNKASTVGVNEYLVKPYQDEVLLNTVRTAVARMKQQERVA